MTWETDTNILGRAPADPLGAGLPHTLRRGEAGDFVSVEGEDNVRSCVLQALGTDEGDLPWRPEFGSKLYRLRHQPRDSAALALAKAYVTEALTRWEPRVRVTDVVLFDTDQRNKIGLRVRYQILSTGVTGEASV